VDEWNKIFGESTTVQYASNWTAIVRPDRSQNDNDIVQYASNVYSNHWQIEIALLPLLVLGWGIVVVAWITVTAAEIAALFAATLWVAYLHQNPQVVPEALATVSQRNHAMITESSRQASCELENIGYELSEMAVDWASCLAWGDWSEWLTCWFEWAMNAFFVILPTWCSWPIVSEWWSDSTKVNSSDNVYQIRNRVDSSQRKFPNDQWTILLNKNKFTRTNKIYDGARIYKDKKTWYYYYRDNLHKDHLEVFNKQWIHLWEANPITWIRKPNTVDPSKILSNNLRS
jgi:hypothetical protein